MANRYLLDLNVLIALSSDEHEHYRKAHQWLGSLQREELGICALTQAGYVGFATNPARNSQPVSFSDASALLDEVAKWPRYRYWPLTDSWAALTAPFASRARNLLLLE